MKNFKISVSSGLWLIYPICKGVNIHFGPCAGRPQLFHNLKNDPLMAYQWIQNQPVMTGKDARMYTFPLTLRVNVGGLSGKLGFFRYNIH